MALIDGKRVEHLGDGAYVSEGNYAGEIILTANHHDPCEATDKVHLDPRAVEALLEFLTPNPPEDTTDDTDEPDGTTLALQAIEGALLQFLPPDPLTP